MKNTLSHTNELEWAVYKLTEQAEKATDLIHQALDFLSNAQTEDFARGGDRQLRRDLAVFLGLDPDDYSL